MDNDDLPVGRLLTRREALRATARAGLGFAIGGAILRGGTSRASALPTTRPRSPIVASPELTEGPFFVDEKLNRSDLVAGTQRATVVDGLPLLLTFTVYQLVGKEASALKGAQVDLWQADIAGAYSDESNPMNGENTSGQTWLRGFQLTDDDGAVQFKTIFPGWYNGRAPHVHFKVRWNPQQQQKADDATASAAKVTTAEFTSQVFFRENDVARIYGAAPYAKRGQHDTSNADDSVYNDATIDGTPVGQSMLLDLQPLEGSKGYSAILPLIVTMTSGKGQGRRGGPGGHGGGPGGPAGPGGPPGGFGPPPGRRPR